MILLLVILLGIYLRELRTENVYEAIKLPLFRKEGVGGRFNYSNLFKINLPNPSLQKRGFFMMLVLVVLLEIYLRELRTESIYLPIKSPLFRKERARGRFNYCNLFKINLPNPSLQKRGFFMMLLLVVLLEIYLRELRTENVYEAIKLPLFRKEGAGGDSLFQSIQNQFPHHFNMCFFSIQCGDIVIRHTTVI